MLSSRALPPLHHEISANTIADVMVVPPPISVVGGKTPFAVRWAGRLACNVRRNCFLANGFNNLNMFQVQIRGTFSEPYWSEVFQCARDHQGTWILDLSNLGLAAGTYVFKFIVDGEWLLSDDYPSTTDVEGNQNNTLSIKSAIRPPWNVQSQPNIPSPPRTGSPRESQDINTR